MRGSAPMVARTAAGQRAPMMARSPFTVGVIDDPIGDAIAAAGGERYLWTPSTCYTDVSRTTPAAVGDTVGGVQAQFGNHASQSTAGARPTLRQEGDLYYLEGDGGDWLSIPVSVTGWTHCACFGVAFVNNTMTTQAVVSFRSSSSTTPILCQIDRTNAPILRALGRNDASTLASAEAAASALSTTPRVLTIVSDGSTLKLRRNGVQLASVTQATGSVTVDSGRLMAISSAGTAAAFLSGRLYPGVLLNAAPSAGLLARIEQQVAALCGVSL